MVCKKSIISKVLVVFIAFFAFLVCSFPSKASSIIPRAIWSHTDGNDYFYYKDDGFIITVNGVERLYDFSEDVILLPIYFNNSSGTQLYIYYFSKNKPTVTISVNDSITTNTSYSANNGWNFFSFGGSASVTSCSLPPSGFVYNGTDVNKRFISYLNSVDYIEPSAPDFVDVSVSRSDIGFGLNNVVAECESDILTISWSALLSMPKDAVSMPVMLDLLIEDLDSGESAVYYYPSTESRFVRPSLCDVSDLSVSFDVRDIKDIPTNFNIKSLTLTPYYIQHLEYLDMDILYKGQNSIVFLNYSGQNDKIYSDLVIQTPPDTTLKEEDVPTSIFGAITNFFSGFFSNFGNMLKDLFIPSKEQIQSLFGDMENFFSDKLGFLWFPFDLAITIVETFTYGEADSVLTVPPITINILGGIDLYPGGQFDMDATGIFPYVRIVTSILLACAVAGLAYNKWDEWIGGHDN